MFLSYVSLMKIEASIYPIPLTLPLCQHRNFTNFKFVTFKCLVLANAFLISVVSLLRFVEIDRGQTKAFVCRRIRSPLLIAFYCN